MLKRIFSSIALWLACMLIPYFFGVQGVLWIIALVAVLTQYELYSLLIKTGFRPQRRLGCLCGASIILGSWYLPQFTYFDSLNSGMDLFTLSIICLSLTVLFRTEFSEAKYNIMPTLLGLLLVPFMFNFYVLLLYEFASQSLPLIGILLIFWLVAVAKFTDVGGLFVGKWFGRHKLAKEISPGKTWEGALGGIIMAILIGTGLCYMFSFFTDYLPYQFTPLIAGLMAIPISVISIASDLIESVLKRKAEVKDSGSLIPGIGGILDLTDSLLLSAPTGYLLFKHFIL